VPGPALVSDAGAGVLIFERCLLLIAWLTAAYGAGHLASSWSRRPWVRIPVTLLVALLPVWDVIPGVIACQLAIRELGGPHLYRVVSADGYLDLRRHSDLEVWSSLPSSPYLFIEIHSDRRPLSSDADPAYYQLTLALRGGPSCAAYDALPKVIQLRQAEGLGDFCPVVQRRDAPISRYQVEASPTWQPLPKYDWLRPVEAKWARISDRSGKVVLAESYALRYLPWIATVGLDHLIGAYESENATDALVDINVPAVIRPNVLP
jgi:hypothetical protein